MLKKISSLFSMCHFCDPQKYNELKFKIDTQIKIKWLFF